MLYYDERLSRSQKLSCNSCHPLDRYGTDGKPTSQGHKGIHGTRNSPTVYNAAAQFAQFWDGRADTVEAEAKETVLDPSDMAMASDKAVVAVLESMPDYVAAFQRAFPSAAQPVTFDNVAEAIGAFERKLVTPSRWDKFLAGDSSALTAEEIAGFNAFTKAGCQTCHSGVLVGGQGFERLGIMRPYPESGDPGRSKVTGSPGDRTFFKIASLRNVAKTAPYFHRGQVVTLHDAVVQMADYQLGRRLTEPEASAIVSWLKSLTGDLPAEHLQAPELPKSTPTTPSGKEGV